MNDTTAPLSVAEASEALEEARTAHRLAKDKLAMASAILQMATATERAAYRAFNEAVAAMRPVRGPRKPKPEGSQP
jgi:hypothetical protein